ncbi:aKG-HExxH-type peptide beta-hydroxylase [Streptomyces paludis]|uniref:HEXXH motif domain-containing protein n=1 Tax=Streptomyces paludis TaxID=2282738 RepID=A0A345HI61_9ACTN|nr:HEXXH motif-containing putative peptide modification protein [Streptomyces paludis]AXG76385.1 hypothetical protein DVK44_00345 [Streptomyces paludis]
MHVEADVRGAVEDRREVLERIRAVLDRVEFAGAVETAESGGAAESGGIAGIAAAAAAGSGTAAGAGARASAPPMSASVSDDVLRRPAAMEAVHTAQRALRSGASAARSRAELGSVLDLLAGFGPPAFGPTGPQDHLRRSVSRALRSAAPRRGRDGTPVTARVVAWDADQRQVLVSAVALLTDVWPELVGELAETVTEVALLDGDALDRFTDFTVHGAVLVHRNRLTTGASGLPGPVRCAEALVHEGAHSRYDAAAVARPFLLPEPAGGGGGGGGGGTPGRTDPGALLVTTPLRADPRPLSGLVRRTVALARCVLLYRRIAALGTPGTPGAPGTLEAAAVAAREARLTASARQAVDTLTAHSGALTDAGRALLDECAAVSREREEERKQEQERP